MFCTKYHALADLRIKKKKKVQKELPILIFMHRGRGLEWLWYFVISCLFKSAFAKQSTV